VSFSLSQRSRWSNTTSFERSGQWVHVY